MTLLFVQKPFTLISCVLAALCVTACASPNARIYTLIARDGSPSKGHPVLLVIEAVDVAKYLNRPELIRRTNDVQLATLDFDRWAEPVGGMIQRVLVEDLRQRLPKGSLVNTSQTEMGNEATTLQIVVNRLDVDADGTVMLNAIWQLRYTNGRANKAGQTNIHVRPINNSTSAQIEAMNVAVARLAEDILSGLS
ncbi:PqiC family protein [Brucella intermedia]|uniref:PqiC family protein n=1 Tax=Brucella intermedia TaxID=94625 RepID=UPI00235ED29C|nr:PqiC family protein [Brucella intermedia]